MRHANIFPVYSIVLKKVAPSETLNTLQALHFKKCEQSEQGRQKQINYDTPENINHKGKLKKYGDTGEDNKIKT